jgi:hemerythrin-like domain-containing protein
LCGFTRGNPFAEVVIMMPIAPLMIEHRVIEKMIFLIEEAVPVIEDARTVDGWLIDTFVDFIRTYADRCHHGKEEEILFRDLERKRLVEEHRQIMNELIEDHKWGRMKVSQLLKAKDDFLGGKQEALAEVITHLKDIATFYPKHIEKEDKHFFLPCMDYFTESERDRMLEEEMDFDKGFIHKIYKEKTIQVKNALEKQIP